MDHNNWKTSHRLDRIEKEDWYMLEAIRASWRSPDPNTQVGACLVTPDGRPLGSGYNGAPRGMPLTAMPWERKGDWLDTKYAYVVHAEKNAILNSVGDTTGSIMYATMFPCNECAKDLVQAGVRQLFYLTNPYIDQDFSKAAAWILGQSYVRTEQYQWKNIKAIHMHLKALLETIPLQE